MEWYAILALVLGIPLIIFPVAIVLYLNVGGVYQMLHNGQEVPVCLDRRLKILISILLTPLAAVIIVPFLIALTFVALPLLSISVPLIITLDLIYTLRCIVIRQRSLNPSHR